MDERAGIRVSFWRRLWWAIVGWKTDDRVFESRANIIVPVPGGVLANEAATHLNGSVDLCVDLLSAHFHPSFPNRQPDETTIMVGGLNPSPYYDPSLNRGLNEGIFHGIAGVVATSDYGVPLDISGKVDILLSAAAWYALKHGIDNRSFVSLCEVAWAESTEMG
jgi:hypothetical protein